MRVEQREPDIEHEIQPDPVRIGRTLGRYVLCYELATGGMATVYLARAAGRAGFGRLVALKLIHPHLAKQREYRDMFFDEARIAARIVHPNVCGVFDFGEEDGAHFLAMDYLVGETLGRLSRAVWRRRSLATRRSTLRVFARIVAEACEGLHAAHEARGDDGSLLGVVHRDVSPHNLFVGYDGSVRVVDFGVAMSLAQSHHTAAGTVKGKLPYMSPEQVTVEGIDRRADVWSLGVCLWEGLVGTPLFGRDADVETLQAVTGAPIPLASTAGPHVPAVFDAIVARALSRDVGSRYATAREMGRDLSVAIGKLGGGGATDVAELMDEVFREERAARLLLLDRARTLEPESPWGPKVASAGQGDGVVTARQCPSMNIDGALSGMVASAEALDTRESSVEFSTGFQCPSMNIDGALSGMVASAEALDTRESSVDVSTSAAATRRWTELTEPFESEPGAMQVPLAVAPSALPATEPRPMPVTRSRARQALLPRVEAGAAPRPLVTLGRGPSARSGRALAIAGLLSAGLTVLALALLAFGWSGDVRASSPSPASIVVRAPPTTPARPARLVESPPPPAPIGRDNAADASGPRRAQQWAR